MPPKVQKTNASEALPAAIVDDSGLTVDNPLGDEDVRIEVELTSDLTVPQESATTTTVSKKPDSKAVEWQRFKKQKCAVNYCFCDNTGAYFPNPYRAGLSAEDRVQEEARYDTWIRFCNQGPQWTPQFTKHRIHEFIGWAHFQPTDYTRRSRHKNGVDQIMRRLNKGVSPSIPDIVSKADKMQQLGLDALLLTTKPSPPPPKSPPKSPVKKPHDLKRLLQVRRALNAQQGMPTKRFQNALDQERRLRRRLEEEVEDMKRKFVEPLGKTKTRVRAEQGAHAGLLNEARHAHAGLVSELASVREENVQLKYQLAALGNSADDARKLQEQVGALQQQVASMKAMLQASGTVFNT